VAIGLSVTSVDEVVEAAIGTFERAGIEIRREASQAVVSADPGRLRHILVNLLSNAVRHGGPAIGVQVSPGDNAVAIEVWDDGPGVPEDKIERLFERFIHHGAAPLLTGSVGLGLAVASRLAAMMGGRLSYRHRVGKTYFTVHLPLYAATEEGEPVSAPEMIRALLR
jgi:signal transduction histidine kinase